jgi:serine/threonine protein kinase
MTSRLLAGSKLPTFPGYKVDKIIGRGSFGTVFLAHSEVLGMQVVLKEVKTFNEEQRKSAGAEIEALRGIEHVNIVRLLDSFTTKDAIILVQEYCEFGDLQEFLKSIEPEVPSEALLRSWMKQMLEALSYLHARKIVHRDFKTGNSRSTFVVADNSVFIASKDRMHIRLGDFGLSRSMTEDLGTTMLGTPFYMAPEMLMERGYSEKIDIWALGCALMTMVVSRNLLQSVGLLSIVATQSDVKRHQMLQLMTSQGYSKPIKDFLVACLANDAAERPSADALLMHPFITMRKQVVAPREDTTGVDLALDPMEMTEHGAPVWMADDSMQSPDVGIGAVQVNGLFRYWNAGMGAMFGFRAEEVLHKMTPADLQCGLAIFSPDVVVTVHKLSKGPWRQEWTRLLRMRDLSGATWRT